MAANDDLLAALMNVVKSNTEAIAKVAAAVEKSAETSSALASEMVALRSTIAGAQKKIGGEIGPMIDRVKQTHSALETERRELMNARTAGKTAERSGSNEGA